MKIRHQVEAPAVTEVAEETKGLMKRIRHNRWTPAIIMAVVAIAVTRASTNEINININTASPKEEDKI